MRRPRHATLDLPAEAAVVRFLQLEAIGNALLCAVVNYLPVEFSRGISVTAPRRHLRRAVTMPRMEVRASK